MNAGFIRPRPIEQNGERTGPMILQIYERNCAILEQNRENIKIKELALTNLLDLIPIISNTDEEVDQIVFQIYERNCAILEQNREIIEIEELALSNVLDLIPLISNTLY